MIPQYFGEGDHRLFGVYHPASAASSARHGVVICPSVFQEYMLTHWALRRLAQQLSRIGVPVLRFDYYGTGDSCGETGEGTPARWARDIHQAAGQLSALSHVERVSLVGHRLGAGLAWLATEHLELKARHLVLWDPVASGSRFMQEVQDADRLEATQLLGVKLSRGTPTQLGGYATPPQQREAFAAMSLLDAEPPKATRVHLFASDHEGDIPALRERLSQSVKRFSFVEVNEAAEPGGGALLSSRMIQSIVSTLAPEAS